MARIRAELTVAIADLEQELARLRAARKALDAPVDPQRWPRVCEPADPPRAVPPLNPYLSARGLK